MQPKKDIEQLLGEGLRAEEVKAKGLDRSVVERALRMESRKAAAWEAVRLRTVASSNAAQPHLKDNGNSYTISNETTTHEPSLWRRVLRVAAVLIPAAIATALLVTQLPQGGDSFTYVAEAATDSVTLPDGSNVILGKGSTLTFRQWRNHRETTLEGVALFTVRHDELAPFTVSAGEATVTVLGTVFSVEHWPGEARVRTKVESGRVGMEGSEQRIYLSAGETGTLTDGRLLRETANTGKIRIDSRVMEFHGATLREVAEEVVSAYHNELRGVRINSEQADSVRITTSFRNAALSQVISELNLHFDKKIAVRDGYLTIVD